MTNDDPEPPSPVVQIAQGPKVASSGAYKENGADMDHPQASNPPETPTPPPGSTVKSTRAPEPMTLTERHQAALRHIHTLEAHNAKLYDDNCRLVNAVNMLNDRLALLGAPQNTQVHHLMELQEKLRTSEASRAAVNRMYQELRQSTSPTVVQHHMSEELQAIREAYASLDHEYRLLADKYTRLKAVADVGRVAHRQSQGTNSPSVPHVVRGLVPAPPELASTTQFRAHDQNRNGYSSPTSVMSPGPLQPFPDQRGNNRRRSSEGTMVQQSFRSGPTPIATTWLAPLPTPPPSAPVPRGQTSPTGFPVHTSMPAGSLPLPHHHQMTHEPLALSGPPQPRHILQQTALEQPNAAIHVRQPRGEIMNTVNNELVPRSKQNLAHSPSIPSPLSEKRPSSHIETSVSSGGEHKKARIDGEVEHSTSIDAHSHPAMGTPLPTTSADVQNDRKLSAADSNVRSYQECVDRIFEKDADVENGIFCGLCLDRYDAKMIPEPPDVLVQPNFDFLVRHCMTIHPTAWDDLRRGA